MSLTPQEEQQLFAGWVSDTAEPTLQNPSDLEYERQNFHRLSKEIKRLRSSLHATSRQISVAKKILEFSACRLFRFDRLPNDIILHIFRQGVFFSPEHKHASLMPLLYSKVCRKWRDLALEASWLWSFIVFPDNYAPYCLTRVYLERSRRAPLIIDINIVDTKFDPDDDLIWPTEDYLEQRMSLFLPHAHRWSSFTCSTDNWAPLSHVVNKVSTVELPLLKDLVLCQNFPDPDDYPPQTPLSPIMSEAAAPRLEQLRLIGLSLNWKHLSELHLNLADFVLHQVPDLAPLPSLEHFYGIISTSTNLRKLSLGGIAFPWDPIDFIPPTILQPIHFPNIEELTFQAECDDNGHKKADLEYLTFLLTMFDFGPKLCSLSLSQFFQDSNFDRFVPVLASKFSRIEHLAIGIGHIDMTVDQLARWLNVLPNLTSLSILCEMIQPIICAALSRRFDSLSTPILCPLLHSLCPHNPHDGLVPVVVIARLGMKKPLRNIIWNINDREAVRGSTNYRFLRRFVAMAYDGEIIDPAELWVGPDGEYDNIIGFGYP